MNSILARLKHYIFNVSIFRMRYIVFKELGRQKYYVKVCRRLRRTYYLDPSMLYSTRKFKRDYLLNHCYFKSLDEAKVGITTHSNTHKTNYLRIRQVFEQ